MSTTPGARDPAAEFAKTGEEQVFAGWIFTVGRAWYTDPHGEPFDRFIVHHPGAVAVVPLHEDRTVTLVRQFRPTVGRTLLEVPAGTRDVRDEPPERTARRELIEEAGLQAESLATLVTTYNSPGYSDQLTFVYLATGLTADRARPVGIEERWMSIERIALDEVPSLIADGRLVDETTVLGLLLARQTLERWA